MHEQWICNKMDYNKMIILYGVQFGGLELDVEFGLEKGNLNSFK